MTQLILADNIYLPQTSHDKYKCYPAQLGEQVDMISGRRVLEVRGWVQMIEYEYDYGRSTQYSAPARASRRPICPTTGTAWWCPPS